MELGIFAKTFEQPSVGRLFDEVKAHGFRHVQFNMACAGLSSMPDLVDQKVADQICLESSSRGIHLAAVSGTFNMIHPDLVERQTGLARLAVLAASCKAMNTSVITLCSGTRDPENMWRKHPENKDASAWRDLLESMEKALQIAERYDVTLAFEPEESNVVDDARKGFNLLKEMRSDRLKVVMDGANLLRRDNMSRMKDVLTEAFDLLGESIIIAHAKDISVHRDTQFVAAGQGMLDYAIYLRLLRSYRYEGPLILHGLTPAQVPSSVEFLNQKQTDLIG